MSELTKQYFDKQLGKLATKEDIRKLATKEEIRKLATKEDIKNVKVGLETKIESEIGRLETKMVNEAGRLEAKIESEIAGLARMTNNGLEEIKKELNVKSRVDNLDRRMYCVEQSLNIKS